MQIADIWLRDMPQQFQCKRNIEVLIKAFSKQMQELDKVFRDLNAITDIDTAVGQNLDYVGTIVALSRKEAGELVETNDGEPVISDERYRQLLKYKVLKNTNNGTYYDIINSLCLLWDTDSPIFYTERKNRPAMIFIGIPKMSIDEKDPRLLRGLRIKSAGVGLIYVLQYAVQIFENEQVILRKIKFKIGIPFWGAVLFNGAVCFDGTVLMNAKRRYGLGIELKIHAGIDMSPQETVEAVVETKSKDYCFFDGSVCFDGSRKFNSIYRKETIE